MRELKSCWIMRSLQKVIRGFSEPSASASFFEEEPDVWDCPNCEARVGETRECLVCDKEICWNCECEEHDDLS